VDWEMGLSLEPKSPKLYSRIQLENWLLLANWKPNTSLLRTVFFIGTKMIVLENLKVH
jgi:hypothetical protein